MRALTDEAARYWLALDGWNQGDTACLLDGIDPINPTAIMQLASGRRMVVNLEPDDALAVMIARAFEAGALHSPAKPSDVIAWAKSKGLRLPRQFLDWQSASEEQTTGKGAAASRRDARIAAIVETARQLKYDPQRIPYGGKAAIERECLGKLAGEPCRFTADTFKSAWQAGRDAGLIDVENADAYRGRQAANPHGC